MRCFIWKIMKMALKLKSVSGLDLLVPYTECSGKIVGFFSQFTATPPSPTSLYDTFKALNVMRVYSHSYCLVVFVQPISGWRGRGGKLLRILGKKTKSKIYLLRQGTILLFSSQEISPLHKVKLAHLKRGPHCKFLCNLNITVHIYCF